MKPSLSDGAIGLYVHLPFCRRKCLYCSFYSVPIQTVEPEPVLKAILSEWDSINPPEPVETLYIGGGSPNVLGQDRLCRFLENLQTRIKTPPCEFTVEISPPQLDSGFFKSLANLGVNRISIGAQSFHQTELDLLGRAHTPRDVVGTFAATADAGFQNISIDLIAAIPNSAPNTLNQSIQQAVALKPAHISLYCLEWEPQTPLTQLRNSGKLDEIDQELQIEMLTAAQIHLAAAGFRQYEISNYARAGFECQHNLRYWKNLPVIGIGPAASSWYAGKRTDNIQDIQEYVCRIQNGKFPYEHPHKPTALEIACQTAVLGLRMTDGIRLAEFKQQTGFDFETLFADPIAEHMANGLLEKTTTHIRLSAKGLWLADMVSCDFLIDP